MKLPIIIGSKAYGSKKAAKENYSRILNQYEFGESVSDEHYHEILDLVKYYVSNKRLENGEERTHLNSESGETNAQKVKPVIIQDVRIAKFQFNTKCFEIVPSEGEPLIISYRHFVDSPKVNSRSVFNRVCRNTVQKDLISVKQSYFKKHAISGKAPCQKSKIYFTYENLVVDHRQPNTFSVIVDRFIELNGLDVNLVEYEIKPHSLTQFKDSNLSDSFRKYHEEKALLRIVDKALNLSRSGFARLKPMKDDLRITD